MIVSLGLLTGCSGLPAAPSAESPATLTDTRKAPAAPAGQRFGMAMGDTLRWLADPIPEKRAELDRQLTTVAEMGTGWVRLDVPWNIVQANGRGTYWWDSMDVVMKKAAEKKLQVLGILAYTPTWARVSGCGDPKCQPASSADFAAFAAAAAKRYAPLGVHTWEIWNEPNLKGFWKPQPNVAAYSALVRDATAAIRAVDPSATIVVGSLAPARTYAGDISPTDFLKDLYAQTGGKFDAVSYHAYSYPFLPEDPNPDNPWNQLERNPVNLRQIMRAGGDGAKKIWITEYGAPSSPLASDPAVLKGLVTPERQAQMLSSALKLVNASTGYGPFFYYSYRDLGTATDTLENFFGLFDAAGQPKPAYTTYRSAISTLAAADLP